MNAQKVLIIGVSGGSGSGKTTFARMLHESITTKLGPSTCAILSQDNYYIDQSARFTGDGSVNFDHPSAIDFPLLAEHLKQLKDGKTVNVPIYDFVTHTRSQVSNPFSALPVVILDGMLIFSQDIIVPLLDQAIFIDAPEQVRFDRRLTRDVRDRGRTPEGVKIQFESQVKPMHDQFIEPSKERATMVVSSLNRFDGALQEALNRIFD
jgi:uridine kinase